jgi:hypothetical protein
MLKISTANKLIHTSNIIPAMVMRLGRFVTLVEDDEFVLKFDPAEIEDDCLFNKSSLGLLLWLRPDDVLADMVRTF